jgi:hypothetical protein
VRGEALVPLGATGIALVRRIRSRLPKSTKHRILVLSTESGGGVCVSSVPPSRLERPPL